MASPAAVLNIIVTANNSQATGALAKTSAQLKQTAAVADASTTRVSRATAAAGARIAAFGKASAIGVGAVAAASTKLAVDFERAMRNVNAIAQLPERQFKRLGEEVRSLAGKTAQAPQTLAEGLYDLVSSGFDAQESLKILKSSAVAATAGLTDTKTSTKAVAAALNAYRLPASKASEVSNIMFRTVDRGVVSFEELAGSIGMVLPAAQALDVNLEQVGAAISTLTKQGQSGANAVVNINAAMTALFKPSEAMKEAFNELGVESGEALTKTEGFQGALEELIATTDGTTQSVGELFGNVRAQRAVFGLTGNNVREANKDLAAFRDTAGATADAFAEQSKSLAVQWQKFSANLQAAAIGLGNKIIPELRDLLEIVQNPKLTLDEKVAALGDKLVDAVGKWLPKVAEVGAGLGLALVEGIGKAILNANLWGKLFLGAGLIRLIGGKGALLAIGKRLGGWILGGVGSAMAAGKFLGGAGVAGRALGIAGALMSAFKRSALLAVGVYVAEGIMGGIQNSMERGSSELRTALDAIADPGFWDTKIHVGFDGVEIGVGEEEADRLREIVDTIQSGRRPTSALAKEARQLASDVGLSADAQKELNLLIRQGRMRTIAYRDSLAAWDHTNRAVTKTSDELRGAKRRERRTTDAVRAADEHLQRVRDKYPENARQVIQAERRLERAKERDRDASKKLGRAERVHGDQRKVAKDVAKDTIKVERERITALQKEKQRLEEAMHAYAKHGGSVKEARRLEESYNRVLDQLDAAQRKRKQTLSQVAQTIGSNYSKKLRQMSDAELGVQKQSKRADRELRNMAGTLKSPLAPNLRGAATAVEGFGGSFQSSAYTAYQAMSNTAGNVTRMTKALSDTDVPSFGLQRPKKGKGGSSGSTPSRNNPTGAQRGAIVPGAGTGDKVPLHLDGRLAAMVEPGELVSVANKKATAALMKVNDEIPRFAGGGIVALGKQLQKEGYEVGENPAFGGVTPGVHDPGGYHPTGQALDVNDDSAPFAYPGGETASLTRLYNRLKGMAGVVELLWQVPDHYDHLHVAMAEGADATLAGAGGQVKQIARQIITGPDGAIKDYTQAAVDRVRQAANKYLSKFGGSTGGVGDFSGKLGAATVKGRATWFTGGTMASGLNTDTDPGIALNPNAGGPDPSSWNNPTTQAWLQARQPFLVKVGGKQAVLPVLDMGPAGWTGNAIDVNRAGVTEMGFTTSNFPSGTIGTATLVKKMLGGVVAKLGGGGHVIPQGEPGTPIPGAHYVPDIPMPNIDLPSQYATGMVGAGGGGGGAGAGGGSGDGTGDPKMPKLAALVNDLFKSDKAADRRKLTSRFLKQLKAFGLPTSQAEELQFWTQKVADAGEYADRAGTLGQNVQGKSELEWLQVQLKSMTNLRNMLIAAYATVERHRRKMQRLLERAQQQLKDVKEKVKRDKERVEAIAGEKGKLAREAENLKAIKEALGEERKKPKNQRNKEKIAKLLEQQEASEARTEKLKHELKQRQKVLGQHEAVRDSLRDPLLPGISERVGWLKDGASWSIDRILEDLNTLQGAVPDSIQFVEMDTLPPLGDLGGDIFDTQMRIRDLLAEQQGGRDPLTIQELMAFADAVSLNAVMRMKGGTIPAYAAGGLHAAGGLALVGERGPEIASLPAGTRVHSNQASQGVFNPTIYADIYIGGEKIAERVQMAIKENESSSLGNWRAGVLKR